MKDINDMPPQFTKDEWFTEVDETDGTNLPEMPILTVTVHDDDETNKFQYKVSKLYIPCKIKYSLLVLNRLSKCFRLSRAVVMAQINLLWSEIMMVQGLLK